MNLKNHSQSRLYNDEAFKCEVDTFSSALAPLTPPVQDDKKSKERDDSEKEEDGVGAKQKRKYRKRDSASPEHVKHKKDKKKKKKNKKDKHRSLRYSVLNPLICSGQSVKNSLIFKLFWVYEYDVDHRNSYSSYSLTTLLPESNLEIETELSLIFNQENNICFNI